MDALGGHEARPCVRCAAEKGRQFSVDVSCKRLKRLETNPPRKVSTQGSNFASFCWSLHAPRRAAEPEP